jgi:hypothetical protein
MNGVGGGGGKVPRSDEEDMVATISSESQVLNVNNHSWKNNMLGILFILGGTVFTLRWSDGLLRR